MSIDAQSPTSAGVLADEIRQLIGMRSRTSVKDRSFPALFDLLTDEEKSTPDSRFNALTRLIDQAIADIDDPAHRHAATALLGSGPNRWATVAQRGAEAASAFNCGWDNYRRRRTSAPSHLEDTIDALVASLLNGQSGTLHDRTGTHPAATVVIDSTDVDTNTPTSDEPRPVPDTPHPRTRAVILGVGAAVLLLSAGALAWSVLARGDNHDRTVVAAPPRDAPERPTSCERLTHQVGDLSPTADDTLRSWAPEFRRAGSDLPDGVGRCAGLLSHDLDLIIQPISDDTNEGVGALVGVDTDPRRVLLLYHHEYWTYRRFVMAYGATIGVPVARTDRPDGTRIVELTDGALVGGRYQKSHVVFGAAYATWTRRGGPDGDMGLPISDLRDVPDQGKVQDFQKGRIVISYRDPSTVRWEPVANPATLLPADIAGRVVTADDGSSWWIDEAGVRHWLPTSSDFGCASATGGAIEERIPIIAVSTLPIGEPYRCR